MKTVFIFIIFGFLNCISFAQEDIDFQWEKSFGGSNLDNALCINNTIDGGYIIAGSVYSMDGDVTGNHGSADYWIVKTDQSGEIEWQRSYGGSYMDEANYIIQTSDGGYIIAGYSESNDGDVTGNHGNSDYWVVKIDQTGEVEWQRCYGGSSYDNANCIRQTNDGGYIIAGYTYSNDGDVEINHGSPDYWIIKINLSGDIQWQKTYGGSMWEEANNIQQTQDGGYIIAGSSDSDDGDAPDNHGYSDYWVVKINQSGEIQWQNCYGGTYSEYAHCIQQTIDGGYIISGSSDSDDGDVTENLGYDDYWVVKIDQSGEIQWQKSYGGTLVERTYCIRQTIDGGYIIAGTTISDDGDITENKGLYDVWIVKTNTDGDIQWQSTFGGSEFDMANDIIQTPDGAYVFAGYSSSDDGDISGNHGDSDFWIVKLCFTDPLSITITDLTYCIQTTLVASSGFESYLWNTGETTSSIVVSTGGIYSVSVTNSNGCTSFAFISVPEAPLPYNHEQICMVTTDEMTGKNKIVIEKTPDVGTDSIFIYRKELYGNKYQNIGAIGIQDPGVFIDEYAIPEQNNYQYSISVMDTCGRTSELSSMHKTMLLQAVIGENNSVILSWNPYEGFAYNNFSVFRSNDGNPYVSIGDFSTQITFVKDINPLPGINRYQIRVYPESDCSLSNSSYAYSGSNIVQTGVDWINVDKLSSFDIFPNPFKNNVLITQKADNSIQLIEFYSSAGMKVFSFRPETNPASVNLSQLSDGMYFVKIIGSKSSEIVKVSKAN